MNLINFIEQFPDETSCKLKFKEMQDSVGVTCRHCGSKEHYWQQSIWMYECKHYKTRTTLRSGTVMQARVRYTNIVYKVIETSFTLFK